MAFAAAKATTRSLHLFAGSRMRLPFPITRTLRSQPPQRRWQHKEYFQRSHNTVQNRPPILPPQTSAPVRPPTPKRRPIWLHLLGTLSTIISFLIIGELAGTGLKTWTWLSNDFEPGSEADAIYKRDFIDWVFVKSQLYQTLKAGSAWKEVDMERYGVGYRYQDRESSDSTMSLAGEAGTFFKKALGGGRGVTVKVFANPTTRSTVYLAHFGSGTQGWPSIVHGGIIASLLKDACESHVLFFRKGNRKHFDGRPSGPAIGDSVDEFELEKLSINYNLSVRADELFGIVVNEVTPEVVAKAETMTAAEQKVLAEGKGKRPASSQVMYRSPKVKMESGKRNVIASVFEAETFDLEGKEPCPLYVVAVGTFRELDPGKEADANETEAKAPLQLTLEGKII